MKPHIVPESAKGEWCRMCGNPANHKVEEMLPLEPLQGSNEFPPIMVPPRHEYTAYVCCNCFGNIMGDIARKVCNEYQAEKRIGK